MHNFIDKEGYNLKYLVLKNVQKVSKSLIDFFYTLVL